MKQTDKKIEKINLMIKAKPTNAEELAFWNLIRLKNLQDKLNEIIDRLNKTKESSLKIL